MLTWNFLSVNADTALYQISNHVLFECEIMSYSPDKTIFSSSLSDPVKGLL